MERETKNDVYDFRKGFTQASMKLSDFKTIRSMILQFHRPGLTSRLRCLRRTRGHSPIVVLTLALSIFASGCNKTQATAATQVPEVEVVPVEQRDVPVYGEWVATLDGYVNAQIRPQVSGYIIKQNYTEGSLVRKGQVLFEIDPRPFTAALDRAKGDLAQAQAQLGKSTLDVERDTPLAEAKAIAKSQLDNEVQAKLGAQAAVESGTAAVSKPHSTWSGPSHLAGGRNCGDCTSPDRQPRWTQLCLDFRFAGRTHQSLFPDQRTRIRTRTKGEQCHFQWAHYPLFRQPGRADPDGRQ